MAFTVTATESGSSAQEGMFLLVRVLTGVTESGGATSGAATAVAATASAGTLTPNFSGSYVVFAISGDGFLTGMPAAAANNTYDKNTGDGTDNWSNAQGHYTGTVTAGTPLTYGAGSAGTGQDHGNWCAYELPAAGTPAVDGSSPAEIDSNTLTTITTASFTPPAGSVLVVQVIAGGSGTGTGITMTITDTSGLGLTWTQRAVSSTSDNFQPTWVYTATMPGGAVPAKPAPPNAVQPRLPGRAPNPLGPKRLAAAAAPPRPPPSGTANLAGAGAVTASATVAPTATLAGAGSVSAVVFAYLTGIAGTGTAQYFTDQTGQPYLLRSDSLWGLIVNAGNTGGATTYQSDMDAYTAARAGQGFNAFLTTPTSTTQIGGAAVNGSTWDGVAPFTSPGVLNSTFWTRVDYLLNSALNQGITVVLNVMFMYAIDTTGGPLHGWTTTQYQNYGAAIGARYKNQPNLVWEFGDDDFGTTYDTAYDACLTGIRGAGDTHLVSYEARWEGTSRRAFDGSNTYSWGIANAQFNWVYGYNAAYDGEEYAYLETSPLLVVHMDGWYDNMTTLSGESTELFMRKLAWWILSSGSRGYQYGNFDLQFWPSGSASGALITNSPGSSYQQPLALKAILDTFTSFAGWHQLVPDTSSALVTAGRGTHVTVFPPGTGANYTGGNSYVSASITADTKLAVIYIPAHTTITIDQTKVVSGYTATWVDPASGATSTTTAGSTYNSTAKGTNSAGDADWLLVLQAPTLVIATATLAGAGAVTANSSVIAAGATATLAAAGAVSAVATVIAPATAAGAGSVTAAVTEIAPAALAGAGAVNGLVTLPGGGTITGSGSVGTAVTQGVTGSLAGAGSVTDVVTLICIAALTGAGSVTAAASSGGPAGAVIASAGAFTAVATQAVTATGAGAGQVTAAAGQGAKATAAGAGAVNASGAITGTASITGAGHVTVTAVTAVTGSAAAAAALTALATQSAPVAAAGTGSFTAAGTIQLAFTVGTLTAADTPLATLTASDARTGGPG